MNIRLYKKEDYPILLKWWETNKQDYPMEDMIPPSTFILEHEGNPWICLSLYGTNHKIGFIENLIADPNIKENRKEAVDTLFLYVETFAKKCGCVRIIGITKYPEIITRLEKLGYANTHSNLQLLVKDI
jgi:hypothetical protein